MMGDIVKGLVVQNYGNGDDEGEGDVVMNENYLIQVIHMLGRETMLGKYPIKRGLILGSPTKVTKEM